LDYRSSYRSLSRPVESAFLNQIAKVDPLYIDDSTFADTIFDQLVCVGLSLDAESTADIGGIRRTLLQQRKRYLSPASVGRFTLRICSRGFQPSGGGSMSALSQGIPRETQLSRQAS
jgi:hypothetical protein